MKTIIPILFALFFVGCGTSVKKLEPVSVAPITVIGDNVTKAKQSAKATVTAVKAKDMQAAVDHATNTQAILEVTERQVENYKSEIVSKNEEIKKHNEQVSRLQIERDKYKAAMWKRNWIIVGLGIVILGFIGLLAFKTALRNNPWTGWIVRLIGL